MYLGVGKFIKIGGDVVIDSFFVSVQCQASNEEGCQQYVRKYGSKIHNLSKKHNNFISISPRIHRRYIFQIYDTIIVVDVHFKF